ncbi:competence type IV pilus major pilin ComGC [Enterococcus timonensis]|uniref:competence type IV pilus major pilin ComGC n=1 Tax=Enterococcus timonensis TaxID=1852364 RepID=UPI0008DA0D66|nr:competence type IV pilus major pilin ComGC [Enterococcus timonensis]
MKKRKLKAFTLMEMLVVLLIIGVLLLLFIPNLSSQRERINDTGDESIVKVVETQLELYRLDYPDRDPSPEDLVGDYLTQEQYERYRAATGTVDEP